MATGLSNLRMIHAILYGVFLGGFVAIILLITRIRSLREAVPYGPFLVIGTLLILYTQAP
jgi:prepilin signal peptidase PulO-like enzyme (type II secretory pathway)